MTADDSELVLRILVIYRRPRDFPDGHIVRGQAAYRDGRVVPEPGAVAFTGDDESTLAAARRHCEALQKVRVERDPNDDPCIVECWI